MTITEALVATAVILVVLYFVFWALSSLSDHVASRQHDRRRARRRHNGLEAPEVPAWAEQTPQPRPLPPWAGQDVGQVADLYGGSHWTGMAGARRPAPKPIDLEES